MIYDWVWQMFHGRRIARAAVASVLPPGLLGTGNGAVWWGWCGAWVDEREK